MMQTRHQVSAGPVLIGDLFNEAFRYLSIRFNYITLSPSQQFEKAHMISQEINSLTIRCEHCNKSIDIDFKSLNRWDGKGKKGFYV